MSKAYIKCRLPVLTTTNDAVLVLDGYKKQTWVPLSIVSNATLATLESHTTRGQTMPLEIQEWKAKRMGVM